jgi:hypothetical protein
MKIEQKPDGHFTTFSQTHDDRLKLPSIDVYKVAAPYRRVQYLYRSYKGAMRLEKIIDVYALLDQQLAMGFR